MAGGSSWSSNPWCSVSVSNSKSASCMSYPMLSASVSASLSDAISSATATANLLGVFSCCLLLCLMTFWVSSAVLFCAARSLFRLRVACSLSCAWPNGWEIKVRADRAVPSFAGVWKGRLPSCMAWSCC